VKLVGYICLGLYCVWLVVMSVLIAYYMYKLATL
jgi:hypothetical protein